MRMMNMKDKSIPGKNDASAHGQPQLLGRVREYAPYIDSVTMSDEDRLRLASFLSFLRREAPSDLGCRTLLIKGNNGTGKSRLVGEIVSSIEVPVLVLGHTAYPSLNVVYCSSLADATARAQEGQRFLLLIDDMTFLFDNEWDHISAPTRVAFLRLIETVRANPEAAMLALYDREQRLVSDPRHKCIISRMDGIVTVELPDIGCKTAFLREKFGQLLSEAQALHISEATIGYTFRDIASLILLAHGYSDGNLTDKGITKALSSYKPAALSEYEVCMAPECKFSDVIGRDDLKRQLKRTFRGLRSIGDARGFNRRNHLLFYGPPGTGKSMMAMAFAGEIGYPLINFKAKDFYEDNKPIEGIEKLFELAQTFERCVLVVDEAEKMLGKRTLEEAGPIFSALHSGLEGVGEGTRAIIIFIANSIARFGETLLDRFQAIYFEPPSEKERLAFCERKWGKFTKAIESEMDIGSFARLTEGFTFRDIQDVWSELSSRYLDGYEIGNDAVRDGIRAVKERKMQPVSQPPEKESCSYMG